MAFPATTYVSGPPCGPGSTAELIFSATSASLVLNGVRQVSFGIFGLGCGGADLYRLNDLNRNCRIAYLSSGYNGIIVAVRAGMAVPMMTGKHDTDRGKTLDRT